MMQARQSGPPASQRPIRFRGGISDYSNATSPVLRGTFGSAAAPRIAEFVLRDVDHADTVYGPFDTFELRFSIPTDRGNLEVSQGDKRWVDRYFDFSCGLGLDYSGVWDDPQVAVITVLDGSAAGGAEVSAGLSPLALAANQLGQIRVTPTPEARFRNKPGEPGFTPSAVVGATPPFAGSRFPANVNPPLCAGQPFCDFGDFSPPQLLRVYIGDMDNSGSWTVHDQLRLTFDRPTNRLGHADGPLDRERLFGIFSFQAAATVFSLDAPGTEWTLASRLRANWTDARTLVIEPLEFNTTFQSELLPDPTQCGLDDAAGNTISCPHQRAMGSDTGAAQTYQIPGGQGAKVRVTVNGSAGLRAESDSPLAEASSGSQGDFTLKHCYAGPMVAAAAMRDPDNLDSVYGVGDEVTVEFTLDTEMPPVATKWDIDKLLTFCTPCNPGCERERVRDTVPIDAEYNGLGAEYRGVWTSPRALVITILNASLPMPWLCDDHEGGSALEPPPFQSNQWFVTTSYSASQAPMLVCYGGTRVGQCDYGEPSTIATTDQFGNEGLDLFGRMLGPRYPHTWTMESCENYLQFWLAYDATPPTIRKWPISGSIGPVGTPAIESFAAADPDDRDLTFSAGDELRIVFNMATDRSNGTMFGTYSGDRLFVDSLFAFNAQLGQAYSGQWADDSIFVITVEDPSYRALPPIGADGRVAADNACTVAPRPTLVIRNAASSSDELNETSPLLTGDAGVDEPPVLLSIVGEDPDLGDTTVAYGDVLRITFDRATDLGCQSATPRAIAAPWGACPYDIGRYVPRPIVDGFFNFSVPVGADYSGRWTDTSTFELLVTDGTGSELNSRLGAILVNTLGTIRNQGCRLGQTLCNGATAYVGPIVAEQHADAVSMFRASFGVPPAVVLVVVDDPDRGDASFGDGDTIAVYFDQATDRGAGDVAGDSAYVDSLFRFSMPIGLEYQGEWADDSTFVVEVPTSSRAPPPPPPTLFPFTHPDPLLSHTPRPTFHSQISSLFSFTHLASLFSFTHTPPRPSSHSQVLSSSEAQSAVAASTQKLAVELNTQIRDRASRSRASRGMAPATNDEAELRSRFPVFEPITPYIVNVTAEDYDNADSVFGAGDTITVRFNQPTNLGAAAGEKAFVDRLFRFDPPIGTDYTGEWEDAQTFRVRALDTVGGELLVCNHAGCAPQQRSNVTLVGELRNRGGTSAVAVSSAHLSGISDAGAPQIARFEVADPGSDTDGSVDYVFSDGDQITIAFDRSSDLGAVEATRKRVDALFSFNIPLGEDYTGEWRDDSIFVITIVNTRYDLPLINRTVVSVRQPIRAVNGSTTEALNATSATLQGNFGHARRPRLASFESGRARRHFGADPGPVYYRLRFDEPTNRTCSFCGSNASTFAPASVHAEEEWTPLRAKASVDELFGFSVLLGHAYWGEWTDASTFELTVLQTFVNTSYALTPMVGVTTANLTGIPALFNEPGTMPASTNELVTLQGDPAELIGPDSDAEPTPVLPHVARFALLDPGAGGLRADGSYGENATLLLEFNTSAHTQGDVWHHWFRDENASASFWGGVWSAAGPEDVVGTHSALEGLQFSTSPGARYEGVWLTRARLLITVLELGGAADGAADGVADGAADGGGGSGGPSSLARLGHTTVHTRIGARETARATLTTALGATVAPRLLSAIADDPDNLDYVYSSGDTVSIYFDRSTDRAGGAASGDKSFVDALFAFSQTLAYDYSGEWHGGADELLEFDSVFRITILQETCPGCTPMPDPLDGAVVKPKDTAAIRTRSGSSPRAYAPSPPLLGDYGKTRGPKITSFLIDDFDNGDATYGSGDTLTVRFDLATDRGGSSVRFTTDNADPCNAVAGAAESDGSAPPGARVCPYDLLAFSAPLGSDVNAQVLLIASDCV